MVIKKYTVSCSLLLLTLSFTPNIASAWDVGGIGSYLSDTINPVLSVAGADISTVNWHFEDPGGYIPKIHGYAASAAVNAAKIPNLETKAGQIYTLVGDISTATEDLPTLIATLRPPGADNIYKVAALTKVQADKLPELIEKVDELPALIESIPPLIQSIAEFIPTDPQSILLDYYDGLLENVVNAKYPELYAVLVACDNDLTPETFLIVADQLDDLMVDLLSDDLFGIEASALADLLLGPSWKPGENGVAVNTANISDYIELRHAFWVDVLSDLLSNAPPPVKTGLSFYKAVLDRFQACLGHHGKTNGDIFQSVEAVNSNVTTLDNRLAEFSSLPLFVDETNIVDDSELEGMKQSIINLLQSGKLLISDETRFLDDEEAAWIYNELKSQTDDLQEEFNNKYNELLNMVTTMQGSLLREKIESSLIDNKMMACFYLPEDYGGYLEMVRNIVWETANSQANAGMDVREVWRNIEQGDRHFGLQNFKRAWMEYQEAYRGIVEF